MSSLGESFVAALLRENDVQAYISYGNLKQILTYSESDLPLVDKVVKHVKEYGQLPQVATVQEMIGHELPDAKEPADFYYTGLVRRHITRALQAIGEDVKKVIGEDPEKALSLMSQGVQRLKLDQYANRIYDFRNSHDILYTEIQAKSTDPRYLLTTGWPYFDAMSGGLRGGDLISLVGRPSTGKTMMWLSRAMYMWKVKGKCVLFISMEMPVVQIFERLSALYTMYNANWIKNGTFPTFPENMKGKFFSMLHKAEDNPVPFYVLDGQLSSTIEELELLVAILDPDAVVVDGAYLVGSSEKHMNRFERVAENARKLKSDIAMRHNVPVLASWQFSKDGSKAKLKTGETPTLEHIAHSDAIAQLSSIVMGAFQEDTPETIIRRRIHFLKGRSGETGLFDINFDFNKINFEQYEEPIEEKLEVI